MAENWGRTDAFTHLKWLSGYMTITALEQVSRTLEGSDAGLHRGHSVHITAAALQRLPVPAHPAQLLDGFEVARLEARSGADHLDLVYRAVRLAAGSASITTIRRRRNWRGPAQQRAL